MAPREQARTRLARAAVVEAARALFVGRGYAATTIGAISEASGVPEPTVYRLFSSKLGILKSLLDVSIAGDAADVPLSERPAIREVFEAPDPASRIAGFASIVADVNARVGPLYRILLVAAGADPEAATLLDDLTQQRGKGQQALVRSLASSLRPGLTSRAAADVVHALASPEVHHLLVVDRRWTRDRYERWLADTLAGQLLPSRRGRLQG
jgi:AcrR family transcriptional regulator